MKKRIEDTAERMMLALECFNGNKFEDDTSEQVKQDLNSIREEYRKLNNSSFTESRRRAIKKYFESVLTELLSNAEGEVKGWVSTSARNPTKQGYYHVLRGGSNPDSVHDSHPAVHFWYADKKEWSSQTDYWLDLSQPQKGERV